MPRNSRSQTPSSCSTRSRYRTLGLLCSLLLGTCSAAAAQSALDGFNPGANNWVFALAPQPDGKLVVGGLFTGLGGQTGTTTRNFIGRLNADGSLDSGFDPGANSNVRALAVQPDGKILVAGTFTTLGGGGTGTTARNRIGRLNADGTLDASFDPGANGAVFAVAVQANGKILVGGSFTTLGGGGTGTTTRNRIGRLNADGSLDASFDPGANGQVNALVVQPDGKILIGGLFTTLGGGGTGTPTRNFIGRLNADGSLDAGFDPGANSSVNGLAVQADGKILVGGTFSTLGGGGIGTTARSRIGRLTPEGSIDAGFDPGAGSNVNVVAVQPDGKVLVGGVFTGLGGGTGTTTRNRIGRLHPDGSVDASFNPGASSAVNALAVETTGKVVVGGQFTGMGGGTGTIVRNNIGRLHADGSVEVDFNPGANSNVAPLAMQPDGKILVGGIFSGIGGGTGTTSRSRIGRINVDGSIDTFDPGASSTFTMNALVVQPDGKIVAGGNFTTLGGGGTGTTTRNRIGRLHPDGSLDLGFDPGANGLVRTLALQPDGKILVGGDFSMLGGGGTGTTARSRIGRLNADGSLDESFDPGANSSVFALTVQPDGKILVAGTFTGLGGGTGTTTRLRVGRLNADGSLDASFNPSANSTVRDFVVQADDKIIIAGDFTFLGLTPRNHIARLSSADGSVDPTFDPGSNSTGIFALALQTDGKILVGGPFTMLGGGTGTTARSFIGRLNPDGSVDAFDPGANTASISSLGVAPDGKILVSGAFTQLGGGGTGVPLRNRIGRLTNTDAALERVGASTEVTSGRLSVTTGGNVITWSRGGTAPEVWRVTFELSTDGVVYAPLGSGTRINGGWQVSGVNLPTGQNVYVRARGYYSSATSGSIVESIRQVYIAPSVELLTNGNFGSAEANWSPFSPAPGGIVWNVTAGVFQFYRQTGATEAEVIQATGLPLAASTAVEATFDLGNSDNVRKRVKVLLHDLDFTDSLSCTFFLDANAPLRAFTMRTHTTKAWTNATISIYGSTAGSNGGFYRVDNVSFRVVESGAIDKTECIDPMAPPAPGGAAGADLIVNGDFATPSMGQPGDAWNALNAIVGQFNGGVLEFRRSASLPAPVILQVTGQAMANDQILTATFQLGNSSATRHRTKVLVHDVDFSDAPSCVFWIPPGQGLQTYTMRVYTTKAWTNATISFYPSTGSNDEWTRLDNVTLQRTPADGTTGTNCYEPAALAREATSTAAPPRVTVPGVVPGQEQPADPTSPDPAADPGADWPASNTGEFITSPDATWTESGTGWEAVATATETAILRWAEPIDLRAATEATLTLQSWLSAADSRAEVQVSTNGVNWLTVSLVPASSTWVPIEIDLRDFLGEVIQVQFVFHGVAPADLKVGGSIDDPDVWRIDDIQVTR